MKLNKSFSHALKMVLHSKLRSWLTILGIVIGVAAVIAIMSIGTGMQEEMSSRLSGLGGDLLTITAGFSRGGSMFGGRGENGGPFGGSGSQATEKEAMLTRSDLQILRGMSEVALINPTISGRVNVSYLGKSGTVSATGVDQRIWAQITTSTIDQGRMLDAADQNVVVIGGRLASSYFDSPVGINKMLTIQGSSFRVVGILDDESNSIYLPLQMAYQVMEDKTTDVYDSITVKVKDEDVLDETIATMEKKLMNARHVTEKTKDFSISSSKQMQETISSTMSSMNAFLLAIAAVSLIVGAVGIANTMFTSVLERTKDIGIMKAIGARNHDILLIFLFNAALIGFIGGIIGIVFGTILSGFLPELMGTGTIGRGGITTLVSMNSVIISLSVSVTVGILAGIVPAYQASKLKPVDALRYE